MDNADLLRKSRMGLTSLNCGVRFILTLLAVALAGEMALADSGQTSRADTTAALQFIASQDASPVGVELDHVFHLNDRTIALAELSGAMADQGFGILSGGVGLRRLLPDSQTFVGVNAFYDALRDPDGFSYSQLGFGAEISRGRFTLRGNYYLPVGSREQTARFQKVRREQTSEVLAAAEEIKHIETDVIQTSTFQTRALDAWDVELEMALLERPGFFDPSVAVGYYGVMGGGANYSGVKLRAEVGLGKYVKVGAEWRQDGRGIGQEWRAGVRLEIPLGKAPSQPKSAGPGALASARHIPNDGKTFRPVTSDGKSVASDSKAMRQPLFEEEDPLLTYPPGFLAPIKRSPWPNTIVRETKKDSPSTTFTLENTCNCGKPLDF